MLVLMVHNRLDMFEQSLDSMFCNTDFQFSEVLICNDGSNKGTTKEVFDYVVDLDVSSPLRNIQDIRVAFQKCLKKNYDNLFSVFISKKNPYFNMVEIIDNQIHLSKKSKKSFTSRQTSPRVYSLNASIYIWKRDSLLKKKLLIGKKTGIYEMPEERSIDIDSDFDLKIVNSFIKKI